MFFWKNGRKTKNKTKTVFKDLDYINGSFLLQLDLLYYSINFNKSFNSDKDYTYNKYD